MRKYDDIIKLKRPVSKHVKLGISSRASQFLAFSALVGYDDLVNEKTRKTDGKKVLEEDYKEILDFKLSYLSRYIDDSIVVKVTYFVKDKLKDGGKYITSEGTLNKIDYNLRVIKVNNKVIEIDNIIDVDSEIFDII